MINKMSLEEESVLASEFTYHDKKAGIIGGYCEDGFPLYYANDEIAAMLGYESREEFAQAIDGKVINTIHPDDRKQVESDLGSDYYEGKTYETTYRMPRKDGSWFWTVDKGKVIRAEDGRLAIISICMDMSKFVRNQKELEAQNMASDYMFKNLPGGYHRCALDEGFPFLYVSQRFLGMLGWTEEELHEKFDNKFMNLVHPEDKSIAPEYVSRILEGRMSDSYQDVIYRLQCRDGYHWFSDSTMKVTVAGETFFQGFITDITKFILEKEQKENELEQLLRDSDKRYQIISALGTAYEEVCLANLEEHKYTVLSGKFEGKTGDLGDLRNTFINRNISESQHEEAEAFIDFTTLPARLDDKKVVSHEFRSRSGSWFQVSFIVKKRGEDGKVSHLILTARDVNEQKSRELEYQKSLEEALFAVADGYCRINLTKNIVSGILYQVVDGKRIDLNKKLGFRQDANLPALISELSAHVPVEERQDFISYFDNQKLIERFRNGETHVSFSYWISSEVRELILAEHHMEMYSDTETGDVIAVNYVIDRTEQYRVKQQSGVLEKKNQKLQSLLRIQSEYNGLLYAISKIYWQIFTVDLINDTYSEIYAGNESEIGQVRTGMAQETFVKAANRFAAGNYKDEMLRFLDHSTLPERLSKSETTALEYLTVEGTWYCARYIVQERDSSGRVTKALFTIQDIDNQKKAEFEQQRINDIRLTTMTEAIHGGFKLGKYDKQFTFIRVSQQLANMLGYDSADEMMAASGGCMAGIANYEDTVREMPKALESVKAGEMYTMHYRVRCKDGSWKSIEDRGRLIRNKDGEGEIWSFIVDQNELSKKSEALDVANKANADLEQTQHELKIARDEANSANKAKTAFLFNMSHDIRTPMNAILGFATLAEKKMDDPEALVEYLHKIQVSGKGMLSILDNVLELSRIESGKTVLEETAQAAGNVFDACLVMVNPEIEKRKHTLKVSKQIKYPYTYFDSTRVTEVILNILSNAIKYTADGGTITCELSQLPHPDNGWVYQQVVVTDNGIGMSEDFQKRIFELFEREHSTTASGIQGTGLGMGIVKKLVDLMGGTIDVKSKLGEGTSIAVQVPCRIATFEETQPKHSTEHIGKEVLAGKHVILAEDNDLNAEIAVALLSEEGLEIDRAEDGVQCIEMLEKAPDGYYSLILMDVQMPIMNGYDTTRKIRRMPEKDKADIPIIAMTANAFAEDRKKALEVGMNDHISKPIDMNKLLPTLLTYIRA